MLTFIVVSGAILMHLTLLGIEINNDGGLLFFMALRTFILSGFILWNERKKTPIIGNLLNF